MAAGQDAESQQQAETDVVHRRWDHLAGVDALRDWLKVQQIIDPDSYAANEHQYDQKIKQTQKLPLCKRRNADKCKRQDEKRQLDP